MYARVSFGSVPRAYKMQQQIWLSYQRNASPSQNLTIFKRANWLNWQESVCLEFLFELPLVCKFRDFKYLYTSHNFYFVLIMASWWCRNVGLLHLSIHLFALANRFLLNRVNVNMPVKSVSPRHKKQPMILLITKVIKYEDPSCSKDG